MKSDEQLKKDSNNRIFGRVVFGLSVGVLTALFLNWKWFFVLIAGYSTIESLILFSIVKRTQLLKAELENQGKVLNPQEKGQIIGHSHGYALSFSMVQFLLSFVIISIFGALAKWITDSFKTLRAISKRIGIFDKFYSYDKSEFRI